MNLSWRTICDVVYWDAMVYSTGGGIWHSGVTQYIQLQPCPCVTQRRVEVKLHVHLVLALDKDEKSPSYLDTYTLGMQPPAPSG